MGQGSPSPTSRTFSRQIAPARPRIVFPPLGRLLPRLVYEELNLIFSWNPSLPGFQTSALEFSTKNALPTDLSSPSSRTKSYSTSCDFRGADQSHTRDKRSFSTASLVYASSFSKVINVIKFLDCIIGSQSTKLYMATQTRASWIFGGLLVFFILGVFAFGPDVRQHPVLLPLFHQARLSFRPHPSRRLVL